MTILVKMRGELEPLRLSGDFAEAIQALNLASAKGLEFALAEDDQGRPIAMAMRNILTIQEKDDEDAIFAE